MISFGTSAQRQTMPARPGEAGDRQRQRDARRQQYLNRLGRDQQGVERASRQTYLVFADRATADEVMREIAVTPVLADGLAWPVLLWDEDAGAGIGTFEAVDGRVAVGHAWTRAERAWLAAYVASWRAVQILDVLPGDWAPKEQAGAGVAQAPQSLPHT